MLGSTRSRRPAGTPTTGLRGSKPRSPGSRRCWPPATSTSHELTEAYLRRIARLNPVLGAVIETNPAALDIAARRDAERQAGKSRGPLHGIPVLLKDNIATNDAMETTAGSLALVGSRVPRDARIVARLRAAGAVILGKANLSEWANFRGVVPPAVSDRGLYLNGWSARGGFTRNPYDLARDPCGSSSGSGVAVAANLCALAIGTETDGSIVCPAGHNAVVGLKPTVGLVAQDGIIPISHSQDTAGPMTRTVIDAAIALDVLRSPFGPVAGQRLPRSYRAAIRPGALRGARIGVDRRLFAGGPSADAGLNAVAERAFGVMADLGAVLVDPIEPPDTGSIRDDEMTVLLTEFKVDMAAYLGGLRRTSMRSLDDLIAFNDEHCGDRAALVRPGAVRGRGGDRRSRRPGLPEPRGSAVSRSPAAGSTGRSRQAGSMRSWRRPTTIRRAPAVAGYPNLSVPTGTTDDGRPGGVWLSGGFLSEATLLAFAADLEAAVGPRPRPTFGGSVPDAAARRRASAPRRSSAGSAPPGATCRPTPDRRVAGAIRYGPRLRLDRGAHGRRTDEQPQRRRRRCPSSTCGARPCAPGGSRASGSPSPSSSSRRIRSCPSTATRTSSSGWSSPAT